MKLKVFNLRHNYKKTRVANVRQQNTRNGQPSSETSSKEAESISNDLIRNHMPCRQRRPLYPPLQYRNRTDEHISNTYHTTGAGKRRDNNLIKNVSTAKSSNSADTQDIPGRYNLRQLQKINYRNLATPQITVVLSVLSILTAWAKPHT